MTGWNFDGINIELAVESLRVSESLFANASVSQVEVARAQLSVDQEEFAFRQAQRDLIGARGTLASLMGVDPQREFSVAGELPRKDPESWARVLEQLGDSIQLLRFELEAKRRQAVVDLEEARSRSDIEVFGGARYFNEGDGDFGLVASVAVPLPVLDRNRGNIRTARSAARTIRYELDAERRRLEAELFGSWTDLQSSKAALENIEDELIPAATSALREVEAQYNEGGISQLALLNSREVLFSLREERLTALNKYWNSMMSIQAVLKSVSK